MDVWECENCGRDNPASRETCILCEQPRVPAVEEKSGLEILLEGSAALREQYGKGVDLRIYGAGDRLTPEEARQMLVEAERDLHAAATEDEGEE